MNPKTNKQPQDCNCVLQGATCNPPTNKRIINKHPILTNIKRCKRPSGSPCNPEVTPKTEATTTLRCRQGWTNKKMLQNKGCQERAAPPSKPPNNVQVNPHMRNSSRSNLRSPIKYSSQQRSRHFLTSAQTLQLQGTYQEVKFNPVPTGNKTQRASKSSRHHTLHNPCRSTRASQRIKWKTSQTEALSKEKRDHINNAATRSMVKMQKTLIQNNIVEQRVLDKKGC